jgi:hypothetical protein
VGVAEAPQEDALSDSGLAGNEDEHAVTGLGDGGEGAAERRECFRPLEQLVRRSCGRPFGARSRVLGRAQRRKCGLEARHVQLVDALGPIEVLEPVLPEVAKLPSLQLGILEYGGRGEGDEYLAAVRGRHDPGGAVDAEAIVPLFGHSRLGRMDAHPHTQPGSRRPLVRFEPLLAVDRSGRRLIGARECEEERVALPVYLVAPVLAHGGAQDLPVVRERLPVRLAQLLQKLCGSLDVREEEGETSSCAFRSKAVVCL